MTVRQPRYSKEEVARRGNEIYERDIRPQVEPTRNGDVVAIDLDTGTWEINLDQQTAADRLEAETPGRTNPGNACGQALYHAVRTEAEHHSLVITGTVNANREAILRLTIRDVNGQEIERDALVDTGFDGWLSLPPEFIAALGIPWHRYGLAVLADGSQTTSNIYIGDVLWDGQPRTILIYELDGEPLVGMSLMYGYELVLPVLDGAAFTLRLIANP